MNRNTVTKFNNLEKFKRRLVRLIARCLLTEKKVDEKLWEDLHRETSCDCKLLWSRMRTIAVKKLKRLFRAEDKIEKITKIAQLTVTDWLLFDLVLVHENVDVIGQEEQDVKKPQKDAKILEELFKLVIEYKIEYLKGDALTRAWYDLTQKYNHRGRKCSPMLLQRRWFQLKELVWYNFYNFWFSYRGHATRLGDANHYKPTKLQREIIQRFSKIVTEQFPSWEQLIEEKKVSVLSDFERLQLSSQKRKFAENEPDLVVIEPQVETIDLRLESDSDLNEDPENESDSKKANDKTKSQPDIIVVKTETIDDVSDEDDVTILEDMHIPQESLEPTVSGTSTNDEVFLSDHSSTHTIDHIIKSNSESSDVDITDEVDDTGHQELFDKRKGNFDHNDDPVIIDDNYSNIKEFKNNKEAEQFDDRHLIMPTITNTALEHKIVIDDHASDATNHILKDNVKGTIKDKTYTVSTGDTSTKEVAKASSQMNINEKSSKLENNSIKLNYAFNDVPFLGIVEFEDDGIVYNEEEDDIVENITKQNDPKENEEINTADLTENNASTIDLKLLLYPVVYTKRLDDMDVFRFTNYVTVKDESILKKALLESSPVIKKSVNTVVISEESQMVCENESLGNELVNSYDCQERVSIKSWYFQKPKVASYNPIQLCKNPDFNTRLKRLTAGFFSSERNRRLLKECKPLTIDLHKSFETKLCNNSLLVDGFPSRVTDQRESIKILNDTFKPSVPVENFTETRKSSPVSVLSNNLSNTDPSVPVENFTETRKSSPVTVISNNLSNTDPSVPVENFTETRKSSPVLVLSNNSSNTENILPNYKPNQILPEKNISYQSNAIKPNTERSKVINLPDVNEIRRTNEKLIAQVIPIQCESNTSQLVDSVHINSKSEKSVPNTPKLTDNPDEVYEILKTHSANDPKSQSKLEENTNENGQLGKPANQLKRKAKIKQNYKPKNTFMKKVASPPPSSTTTQPTEFVRKGMPIDRLLAIDTVERILKVCQGQEIFPYVKRKYKPTKARAEQNETNDDSDKRNSQSQLKNTKRKRRRNKQGYCCWANRQITFLKERKLRFRAHTCPEMNCMCCCKQDYKEELEIIKLQKYFRTIAHPKKTGEKEDVFQETRRMSVAKETDTIYDPEFVPDQDFYTNPNTIHESMEASDTCNLINISNDNQPQVDDDCFTEGLNPIITHVQSLSEPIEMISDEQDKNNTNKMKCKTNIVFSPGPSYLTSPILESSKKFHSFIPEKNKKSYNLTFKLPETPTSVGENEISVSSVKPIEEVEKTVAEQIAPPAIMNHNVLPPGVSLTLIANNELVFSIDPDVELDSAQLSNLQTTMSAVQEELNGAQGRAAIESLLNGYRFDISAEPDNLCQNTNINVETSVAVDNLKMDVFGTDDTPSLVESAVKCVTGSSEELINATENIVLNDESNLLVKEQCDSQQLVNNDEPTNRNQNNEHDVDNEITQKSAKKTILSDLMEMSGISVDDTSFASVQKDSVKDITETVISETQPLVNLTLKEPLSSKFGSVINNATNTNNKSKRLKLTKVSSGGSLQYVFDNRGKFFKMDVDTGTIVPITVKIKRKLVRRLKPTVCKTVIDLTDDGDNEEPELSENNLQQPKTTTEPTKAIKPVRLLKAVNPSILKRTGKSILIPHEDEPDSKSENTHLIQNVKQKRKQDLVNVGQLVDVQMNEEEVSHIDQNVESNLCSGTESDEEPLALKAKRRKQNNEIEATEESEDKSQGENQIDVDNSLEIDVNTGAPTEDEPVNELMSTVLEPVAFNDSSDEDCILGV